MDKLTSLPTLILQSMGRAPPPWGLLPFTQNIFRQAIPENSWLFPALVADAPRKKKNKEKN